MLRNQLLPTLMLALAVGAPCRAQQGNPVYVDDSPQAWELFQLARAQTAENAGEAIRLYQLLLDTYGEQLIPRHGAARDEFVSVRERVLEDLTEDPALLDRYRLIETAAATRFLENGDLDRLTRTRSLTTPGLDAILRSAQTTLESARFRAALAWLDEAIGHPDLNVERSAHAWLMKGLAAHYLGRGDDVTLSRVALEKIGPVGRPFLAELDRQAAEGTPRAPVRGLDSLEHTSAAGLTELVAQTIWSVDLDETLLSRRFRDPDLEPMPRDRKRREGDLTTITATVADSVIYVNEGHTVRALDRFTGRSIWDRPYVDQTPLAIGNHDNETASDLNIIAVEGDRLVTLTGHAYAETRSNDGRIVCLDTRTGQRRWSTSLNRVGGQKDNEGLFPYGAPIIAEGRVYVAARKIVKQSLTGVYVVALDLESGELDWIRHIASSGSKAPTPRPFSTLVYDDRDLFVSTSVGAIARLDAARGSIRWLRRESVPVSLRGRARQPWELGGPVVLKDRIITLTPDQRRIAVLDRATGDVLMTSEARARDRWNAPSYLLGTETHVFAIGEDVRAFSTYALDQPLWTLPSFAQSDIDGPIMSTPPSLEDVAIVGRVQLAGDMLVVPTMGGIKLVDDETGHVRHELAITASGNPVAVDAQLVLAGPDALEVYMSLDRAEEMLRSRLVGMPADAAPALSLLQLGLRVGDLALALEGAELARTRLAETEDEQIQGELFAMLLELHRRDLPVTAAERTALYELIGSVAYTPAQRVEALMARGDGLAETEPEAAVRAFQSILTEPKLAPMSRDEAGTLRPASAWAQQRISALVDAHGPGVHRRAANDARERLTALLARSPQDDIALLNLAAAYPLTKSAYDALDAAIALRSARGDDRGVFEAIASAVHAPHDDSRRRTLLGAFVEASERTSGRGPTRAILHHIQATYGDIELPTGTGPVRTSAWFDRLSPESTIRHPRVQTPDRPAEMLSGRVVAAPNFADGMAVPQRALMLDGIRLMAVGGPDLPTKWTHVLDHASIRVLRYTPKELLVWTDGKPEDPRLISLDPDTGVTRWTTPHLDDVVEPPLIPDRGPITQMPNGLPFDARQTIPLVLDDMTIAVRRTGAVVAFDHQDGSPIWTIEPTLDQVHVAFAHPLGVALSGLSRDGGTGALAPWLVIIDPGQGKIVHRMKPQSRWGMIWMKADPMGSLVGATAEGIEVINLLTGRRRYTNIDFSVMDTRRGWAVGDRIVIESRTGSLFSMDLESGDLSEPFDTAARGTWTSDSVEGAYFVGDGFFARYRDRIARYDAEGNLLGADIISEARTYESLLPTEDGRLVLLSQFDTQQVQPEGAVGRRTQRTYRVYFLSKNCRLEGRSLELPPITKRIRTAHLIDGWLLLSTNTDTIAVGLGGG